ncbi:MAG: transglutaminase-like protein [Rhodobacteraceae bacterium HLUCCA12]|nr:MAG: transglutaminase-like protein [Rhodobacteraceae bacterium HLUCCA12]
MKLLVRHESVYRYDSPVRGVVQSHRLTPARYDGQQVLDWSVQVSGGQMGGGFQDGAGDWVQAWTIPGPVSEITVTVQGNVDTVDLTGVLRGYRERIAPAVYLRHTPATIPDAALTELAQGGPEGDALALAHTLAEAVADAIAYRPGVTHAHTTAAEALALGEGVCQDHTHALIACARMRGMPARYVSGYLHADADGQEHEAAHAWAEIHVGDLGWVGFDAPNRCCPDERYIRLGSGLDARDAAPIRGIARGNGTEDLDVTVAVVAQQQ